VKWNHFTARKSLNTKNLGRDFDSIKIEPGLKTYPPLPPPALAMLLLAEIVPMRHVQ
jgi:hypothetical protein